MSAGTNLPVRGKDPASGSSTSKIPALENGTPPTDEETLQAIIDDNAKDDAEKKSKDFLYDNGFRTEFGKSIKSGHKVTEVETNYLEITRRPQKIYVYRIVMIREYEDETQDDGTNVRVAVHITRRNQKEGIFNVIKQTTPRLVSQTSWATDFDLIWSAAPLFDDNNPQTTPAAFGQVAGQDPITGKPVTAGDVEIKYNRTIDLTQTVVKLFRKQTTTTPVTGNETGGQDDDDDPSVLTRGINAFVTKFARSANNGLTATNANTFYINNTELNLDPQTLKVLRGYFVSLRPGAQSLLLNVNVKHSPFFKTDRLDRWMGAMQRAGRNVRETKGCIKGKIVHIPGNRIALSNHAPSGLGMITAVGDRNQQKPRVWGDLGILSNLLINVGSNKTGQGLNGPEYYRASELTLVDYQPFRGTLNGNQTTNMLDNACQLPTVNKNFILNDALPYLGVSGQQTLAAFGLGVNQQLLKVPARLLAPPAPTYSSGRPGKKSAEIQLASWNLLGVKVFISDKGQFPYLPVLNLCSLRNWSGRQGDRPPRLESLEVAIKEAFVALGLAGPEFKIAMREPDNNDFGQEREEISETTLETLIARTLSKEDKALPVLVILPKHHYDLYSKIKRLCDQKGLHVVCAAGDGLDNFGTPQGRFTKGVPTVSNIGLKFNLKGAGDNQRLGENDLKTVLDRQASQLDNSRKIAGSLPGQTHCQTIIIGADVTHPAAGAIPACPSIAAVVGTVDDNYVKYPGSVRLQTGRQEVIADLADMVKERLIDWAVKHKGQLPTSMLFYRDGVSESQYDAVRRDEIPQLDQAFELAAGVLYPGKATKPNFKLTFVVVGKRHNTRFYAVDKKDTFQTTNPETNEPELNMNVKPGFVIDKKISHPYSNDFFLQSHYPLKGTGRSAHYFVLKNQMKLSADNLQKVTHSLCYIYARATKGVSYCAPAYYADRLCDRARVWLRPWLVNFEDFAIEKEEDETYDAFRNRVPGEISIDDRWNPAANRAVQKYGQPRKNPWWSNLDPIMFYL